MSEKGKVKISYGKEKEWNKRVHECFEELYKSTQGRLLTIMEVALPDGSQLEALKSRLKDIQGRVWDDLTQEERQVRGCYFEKISDSDSTSEEGKESFYEKRVEEFGIQLTTVINDYLNHFQRVVINLTILVVENAGKQEALKEEVKRIITETVNSMIRWMYIGIEGVFEIE